MSTLKEPYRVEGKKTLGYELAEQMDWTLPDVILYPTGGGTGLIGMWKAFEEMEALGWIGSTRPRMFTVQASGCAPIVRAFEAGEKFAAEFPERAYAGVGVAGAESGRRFPDARYSAEVGRRRGHGGRRRDDRDHARSRRGRRTLCGAGRAPPVLWRCETFGRRERSGAEDRIVIFNTGSGIKYLDCYEIIFRFCAVSGQGGWDAALRRRET